MLDAGTVVLIEPVARDFAAADHCPLTQFRLAA
jgi:hypothetical protein